MAEQKRFYWIKLKESFFVNNEVTDWIISQPNGCEYIVLYLKLCLLTANKGGRLAMQIGEMIIPYDVKKISADTKFDVDTVIVAMELFRKIGLIYEEEDGILKIPYVEEIVGSETPAAQRKRKSRATKALESAESVTMSQKCLGQCHTDKEKDKDKREKILDINSESADEEETAKAVPGDSIDSIDPADKLQIFKGCILLSDNQMGELLDLMGLEIFDEYIARMQGFINHSGGYVKNHYETLLKWYREDTRIKK